jgi:hypothetical protein
MRWYRRLFLSPPVAAAFLLAAGLTASAGQPDGGLDLSGAVPGAPAADSGKPMIGGPSGAAPAPGGAGQCAPPLPCGTRLLGSVRKNGAVELQVPALRW